MSVLFISVVLAKYLYILTLKTHPKECLLCRNDGLREREMPQGEIGVTQLVLRHHPNYRTPTQRSVSHRSYCNTGHPNYRTPTQRSVSHSLYCDTIQTTGHLHRDRCHTACTVTPSKLQDTYTEIGVKQLVLRHHPNYRTPTPRSVSHSLYCDTIQTLGHLH